MNDVELPNKLSDLIELALKDLAKAERDPKYKVNMGMWHENRCSDPNKPICHVCFAGAVMAKTKGCAIGVNFSPSEFTHGEELKMRALDQIRQYDFGGAFNYFIRGVQGWKTNKHVKAIDDLWNHFGPYDDLPTYEDNRADFKFNMRLIVSTLREYKM